MAVTTNYGWELPEDREKFLEMLLRTILTDIDADLASVAAPPLCIVRSTANQSLANATDTAITFDTEHVDALGMHSTSSNTDRITVVTPGRYLGKANSSAGNSTPHRATPT